jgi:hypothetical protein
MAKKDPNDITPVEQRFLEAVVQVRQQPVPAKNQISFIAKEFVQVNLPHADPGDVKIWKRTNGRLTLSIRPGWDHDNDKPLGYPYGTLPRLLLFWLTGEVLRTKSRRIFLGETLTQFLRELGLDPEHGGERGYAVRLKDQMERLFRATISFEMREKKEDADLRERKSWIDMQIATDGELWWHPREDERIDWQSWIELSEKFYQAILRSPVPVDSRVLIAFKNTALGLDLYSWLAYKLYQINKDGKRQFITWESLSLQMGSDYADVKNFKRKIKEALNKIQILYPSLKIEYPKGGVMIYPGSLFVPEKEPPPAFLLLDDSKQ